MGLSCTGDEYCRRGDQALQGLDNLQKVVDDSILYHDNILDHLKAVRMFLDRCRENGITLNKSKSKIAENTVKFAGYQINKEGVKADENKIRAIQKFPEPK